MSLNPIPKIPTDPKEQLQWLVDQAAISSLISAFARTLDTRDWEGYGQLHTEDCLFEIGGLGFTNKGREAIVKGAEKSMAKFFCTWHMTGNPGIEIDGDKAYARSYSQGVHRMNDKDPNMHSTGAGWYDWEFRRTAGGWRISGIKLNILWHAGESVRPT